MAEAVGFEPTRAGSRPLTVFRTGRINHSRTLPGSGGDGRNRTDALPVAGRMLSRLSYTPMRLMTGCGFIHIYLMGNNPHQHLSPCVWSRRHGLEPAT